jgi:hypothetical protein
VDVPMEKVLLPVICTFPIILSPERFRVPPFSTTFPMMEPFWNVQFWPDETVMFPLKVPL